MDSLIILRGLWVYSTHVRYTTLGLVEKSGDVTREKRREGLDKINQEVVENRTVHGACKVEITVTVCSDLYPGAFLN